MTAIDTNLFNPLHSDFRRDPRPILHRLRREDPVHYNPLLRIWIITRYDDVTAALCDPRLSSNTRHWTEHDRFFRAADRSAPVVELYRHWMLHLDPPDHTRLRGLLNQAFIPRLVDGMRPRIRHMVNELLDPILPREQMDVVEDFAYPLPILVICDLLGIPRKDHVKIREWSAALLPSLTPALSASSLSSTNQAAKQLMGYFGELIEMKRRQMSGKASTMSEPIAGPHSPPAIDLLRRLIEAQDEGNRLTADELRSTCVLLTFAGHLSTVQLLASAILALGQRPAQWTRLRRDPSLASGVVEETLRFASPLQWVYRATCEEVELSGKRIPAGQLVLLSLAAANRDPEQFPEPDRCDIARIDASLSHHAAFGYGRHFCLGAAFATHEAEIALAEFAHRVKTIEVDDRLVQRESSLLLRGIRSLSIRFCSRQVSARKATI